MNRARRPLYLSPHYDDAALSCGGSLARTRALSGAEPLVLTVFGASPEPNEPLSALASALHSRWGASFDSARTRKAEEAAAMRILGAKHGALNFLDGIYRKSVRDGSFCYPTAASLDATVHDDDLALVDRIADAVEALDVEKDESIVMGPLAVGAHVDHQLVRAAACTLYRRGWEVAFYEDYPYADPRFSRVNKPIERAVSSAVAALGRCLSPALVELREEDLTRRVESVCAYGSQVELLFGARSRVHPAIHSFASALGGGRLAERTWRPASNGERR